MNCNKCDNLKENGICKYCANERAKLHYLNNIEKKKQYSRDYHHSNKDLIKERSKKYALKNKDKLQKYRKNRYLQKKEDILKKCKLYRENNKENKAILDRKYALKYPEKVRAAKVKRKRAVRQATPKWLTNSHYQKIEQVYLTAINLEKETKIPHDVDHIVPIQGKEVCGLHVPWNLRVLPSKENRQKSNKLLQQELNNVTFEQELSDDTV